MIGRIWKWLAERRATKAGWSPADERDLQERRAHHERTSTRAQAKTDAIHAALAHRVWGPKARGWRGGAAR